MEVPGTVARFAHFLFLTHRAPPQLKKRKNRAFSHFVRCTLGDAGFVHPINVHFSPPVSFFGGVSYGSSQPL